MEHNATFDKLDSCKESLNETKVKMNKVVNILLGRNCEEGVASKGAYCFTIANNV